MSTSVEVAARRNATLPAWSRVLAVVAHPDDESFGLGAVLDAFVRAGTTVSVLCLTHGETAAIRGIEGDLADLRAVELRVAAQVLGVQEVIQGDHPDGGLRPESMLLAGEVGDAATRTGAEGLLVLDSTGVTGHLDHVAATSAALRAAEMLGLPVLGWTIPSRVADQLNEEFGATFIGQEETGIDLTVPVDRSHQRTASLAHGSQAVPTSLLWRRLELLGDVEHLRWLRLPRPAGTAAKLPRRTVRVRHREGDRFDVSIRDHTVTVDQPVGEGGQNLGPSPLELFVASLASCVAHYARRYLALHNLDATGLSVEACYDLASRPARVGEISIGVHPPPGLSPAHRDAMLSVARHCTVHNTLLTPPEVTIDVACLT